MKHAFATIIIVLLAISAFSQKNEVNVYGLTRVLGKTFSRSIQEDDKSYHKTFQVTGFWIDKYEVTIEEYKEFLNFVKDSVIKRTLANKYPEKYLVLENERGDILFEQLSLELKQTLPLKKRGLCLTRDEANYIEEELGYTNGQIAIEYYMYTYKFRYFEYGNYEYEKTVAVYPDRSLSDKKFSSTSGNSMNYFIDESKRLHPISGVTWHQAMAYCHYRTITTTDIGKKTFRLPTETEWEIAAKGGINKHKFAFGNDFKGRIPLAKFKIVDSNSHSSKDRTKAQDPSSNISEPSNSYPRNGYGICNMSGNISEWCIDTYNKDFTVTKDKNPTVLHLIWDPEKESELSLGKSKDMKVVKGGSYADPIEKLRISAREAYPSNVVSPQIGFRCVLSENLILY